MISVEESESSDKNWNSRLSSSNLGTIYHTKEYADFLISKNYQPIFLKFLDSSGTIVGQLLVSSYSIFDKKDGIKKFVKYIPNRKKIMYRWIFGPVIFDDSKTKEIHSELGKFLIKKNCKVKGTEHPLFSNQFLNLGKNFDLTKWGTFLIDLNQDIDDIWKKFNKHSAQKNIKRAEKRDVVVTELNPKNLEDYFQLLKNTKSKVGWDIPFDEISNLWKFLNPVGFSGFLATWNDEPIGGILFSFFNNYINEWGVGRSSLDYSEKLYSQDLIKWGKQNNCNYFDLTGVNPNPSTPKELGIFRYKQKWGGDFKEYYQCSL